MMLHILYMIIVDVVITLIFNVYKGFEFIDSRYLIDIKDTKMLLKESFPLCISVLSSLFIINCPRYIINAHFSVEIQGVFNIIFMPTYGMNLLSQIMFKPQLHKYEALIDLNIVDALKLLIKNIEIITMISIISIFIMYYAGTYMLKWMFGQNVGQYRGLIVLFIISGAVLSINQLMYYLFVILRKQNDILFVNIMCAIITLVIGLFIIKNHGLFGSWVTFMIGQIVLNLEYLYLIRDYVQIVSKS